jgi:RNA-directed DNA polymerase
VAGVDHETIGDFERDLQNNLFSLWQQLSSGVYSPKPIKTVTIPKKDGGMRALSIFTVRDRIVQKMLKMALEPTLEAIFLRDSFGYRPQRSGLDAIAKTRIRGWTYDWVLKFDIRQLFDSLDHKLLLKIINKHAKDAWVKTYIQRCLMTPVEQADGTLVQPTRGIAQGSALSPLLSNAFLHYAFDLWMQRTYPNIPWCRYCDDGLVHCMSEVQALGIKSALEIRLAECRLEMHPKKTQIIYCQDDDRRRAYPYTDFEFLGYVFHRHDGLFDGSKKKYEDIPCSF